MGILKVSSKSSPISTAGALANTIREEGEAEIQVIGPKAVNQAIKAIAIARGYIAPSGIDLISIPGFVDVTIDDVEKTAIRILVKPRTPVYLGKTVIKEKEMTEETKETEETQVETIKEAEEIKPEPKESEEVL